MQKIRIKRVIKEAPEDNRTVRLTGSAQVTQKISFEEDPMNYILVKYPSLKETLTMLMTDAFKDYLSGIYVVAPRPTTFKVVLHNNQEFFLTWTGKTYICKVEGKKYYLTFLSDKQRATNAIAQLLEMGNPIGKPGPSDQEENQPKGPEEEETATEEETGGGEEGGEEGGGEEETLEETVKKKGRIRIIKEGAGSGAGAAQTALQESAQCLVNSIRYTLRKDITPKDLIVALKPVNVSKFISRIETNRSIREIVSFLKENSTWQKTSCDTANLLANAFPANFKFYRQAGIVPRIEQAAKAALKSAKVAANINKWNPADIWMATEEVNTYEFPTDLKNLNKLIKELFDKRILIGVSLKKCTGCDYEIFNISKNTKPTQKFDRIESKDKNFFKTKDIYIFFGEGKIQFRNFSGIGGWQGQISGAEAAGGKLGGGVVSRILIGLGQDPLPDQNSIIDSADKLTPDFVKNFYKIYKKVKSLPSKMNEAEFTAAIKKAGVGYRTSNYMNIHLLARLDNMSNKEKDLFTSQIIGYAKSVSEFSSVFVKVS